MQVVGGIYFGIIVILYEIVSWTDGLQFGLVVMSFGNAVVDGVYFGVLVWFFGIAITLVSLVMFLEHAYY